MLDFICMVFTERWENGTKQNIQNGNNDIPPPGIKPAIPCFQLYRSNHSATLVVNNLFLKILHHFWQSTNTCNNTRMKQNRESTEGYRRLKVKKRHSKFGKTSIIVWSTSKSQQGGRNQVSGRISIPCRHSTPIAMDTNICCNVRLSKNVKSGTNVPTGIMSYRWRVSLVAKVEQMQVRKGTEPGVWRSKRFLLASHIRCKCSIETTRNSVKVNIGNKVIKLVESLIGWRVDYAWLWFDYGLVCSYKVL